tara:strand:+ start:3640 stop:4245 length:606 start_codon:yes stop_codon:yes gene_type:complete
MPRTATLKSRTRTILPSIYENMNKLIIKKTNFTTRTDEPGNNELNKILDQHNDTIKKLMILDDKLNESNVESATVRGRKIFNKYKEYKDIQELFYKLSKLQKNYLDNTNLNKIIAYLRELIYKCQTGDILPLDITAHTQYGNLSEKLLKTINKTSRGKHSIGGRGTNRAIARGRPINRSSTIKKKPPAKKNRFIIHNRHKY